MSRLRHRALGLKTWTWIVVVILYVPLVTMIVMSFNESKFGLLPFRFSLKWYESLTPDNPLIASAYTSLQLAVLVTLTCIAVGTLLSMWLARPGSRLLRAGVNGTLLAAVTIPILILSVAILVVVQFLGLGQSVLSLWLACTLVSLPYTVFVITARLQSLDPTLIKASRSLGFGPVQSFWRVTMPLTRSAIVAGALMAFVVCFNNFTVQLFIAPVGVQTLPVNIYSQTRVGISPDINAVASILTVATVALVVVLQLITGNAARVVAGTGKDRP